MRYFFSVVVITHALIHLLGFLKGYELKEVKELTSPISRIMGFMWLLSAVLLMIYAIFYLTNYHLSWLFGFVAVVASQVLILLYWRDARFGTIANVIILTVSFVGFGYYLIRREFAESVKSEFTSGNGISIDLLSEDDIAHLPAIVQKYLHYTKSVGQPKVKNFRAEFAGGMRGKPGDEYMKMHSVQYNFYRNPSRYFFMKATKMGLPATGLHSYHDGQAAFEVNMLNWIKVVDAKGEKLGQAETVTLFNDMCLISPATLIDKTISWEAIDDTTVSASYMNGTYNVRAKLFFTADGALINFLSNDRYETDGKVYNNFPWSTPVEYYSMINGYFLPAKAKLIYHKPEGEFVYGELEYKSVKYNLLSMED